MILEKEKAVLRVKLYGDPLTVSNILKNDVYECEEAWRDNLDCKYAVDFFADCIMISGEEIFAEDCLKKLSTKYVDVIFYGVFATRDENYTYYAKQYVATNGIVHAVSDIVEIEGADIKHIFNIDDYMHLYGTIKES